MDAARAWMELEDDEEVSDTLQLDLQDELMKISTHDNDGGERKLGMGESVILSVMFFTLRCRIVL